MVAGRSERGNGVCNGVDVTASAAVNMPWDCSMDCQQGSLFVADWGGESVRSRQTWRSQSFADGVS